MIARWLLLLVATMALKWVAGCAPYVIVGGKYDDGAHNFEVVLPQGWRKHQVAFDQSPTSQALLAELRKRRDFKWDLLRITRDGLMLQQIVIGRMSLDAELTHTKKRFSKDLNRQELAELILDDVKSNVELQDFRVLENVPETMGESPGFKLIYAYKTKTGLPMKAVHYGTWLGDWFYYLLYEAPEQNYFRKDYATFEDVKRTFRFLQPAR